MRLAYQFQGQKVKNQVKASIDAHTPSAPYLPNGRAYELLSSSWYTDGGTVPVSLETGGGIPCRPNPAATLLVQSSCMGSDRFSEY